MASKRYDISTPRPKKDGGSFWVKIGSAWENEKGIQLVFDALPIPDAEGRCVANLFEPRDRDQSHRAGLNRNAPQDDLDSDDIPF
jgi:hypothetical protein